MNALVVLMRNKLHFTGNLFSSRSLAEYLVGRLFGYQEPRKFNITSLNMLLNILEMKEG